MKNVAEQGTGQAGSYEGFFFYCPLKVEKLHSIAFKRMLNCIRALYSFIYYCNFIYLLL